MLARNRGYDRPSTSAFIKNLFKDYCEFAGDRMSGDDPALTGGIAQFGNQAVTIIANKRGESFVEDAAYNFSMTRPEGFRKALRLMKQAEKFKRPIICFIDTPGAHPGEEAEANGQAGAIAGNLTAMLGIKTPIISVLVGNGASGGALALCVADKVVMLEKAQFGAISPRGCASILWKDSSRDAEAARMMKMSACELWEYKVLDSVIYGGTDEEITENLRKCLDKTIRLYKHMSAAQMVRLRERKYRRMGRMFIKHLPKNNDLDGCYEC